MRIVIDGRMVQESGIGRYIRNLITNLQTIDKENEYFILHLQKDYDTLAYDSNFQKILADFRWYGVTEQIKLPRLLQNIRPDLVHFPHFNVPVFYLGNYIVTIHDLIHQHFQMKRTTRLNPLSFKVKQLGYKKIFKNALKKSAKIIVPSNYIKDLLFDEWGVSNDKVVVTYEAVDGKILELSKKLELKSQKLLEKFNIKLPYIFYVGNAHPHKNVEGLIKAFLRLKKNHSSLKLVLSGNDHYFWKRIKREFQYEDIIYTGFISDKELVGLYRNAECFIVPSFEEGFGIPLLEAMACSCPVVSSNKGSLREVGADAALYFDPFDIEDMVKKTSQVINNEKLRKNLIEKGLKRYRQFSWETLGKKTLEVYKCVSQ